MGGQATESVIPNAELTENTTAEDVAPKVTREEVRKEIEGTMHNIISDAIMYCFSVAGMEYSRDKSVGFNGIKSIAVSLSYAENSEKADLNVSVEFLDEQTEKVIMADIDKTLETQAAAFLKDLEEEEEQHEEVNDVVEK